MPWLASFWRPFRWWPPGRGGRPLVVQMTASLSEFVVDPHWVSEFICNWPRDTNYWESISVGFEFICNWPWRHLWFHLGDSLMAGTSAVESQSFLAMLVVIPISLVPSLFVTGHGNICWICA